MKKIFLVFATIVCSISLCACTMSGPQGSGHIHTLEEVNIPPTCTVNGVRYFQCACLYATEREIIPALGHTYEDRVCIRCGIEKLSNNLEFTLSTDEKYYIVTGMGECTDSEVIIPSVYNELMVKEIGELAFFNNKSIENIYIPSTITSIADGAFKACEKLTTVLFESDSKIKYIEEETFAHCRNLQEINIPDSVTKIKDSAFILCEKLTSVKLPDNLVYLGTEAFSLCKELKDINIPVGITSIAEKTFYLCEQLEQVELPANLEKIRVNAFGGCANIKDINVPTSLECIESYAFSNCTALRKVVIADNSKLEFIGDYSFWNCKLLKEIILPNGLITIDRGSFAGCISLTNIIIPNSVTTLGEGVFYECTGLTSVVIPSSVSSVAYGLFTKCENITIYCVVAEQPISWVEDWNPDDYPVKWGYEG